MNHQIITTAEDLDAFVLQVREVGEVAIDLITTHIEPMHANLVGIALAIMPEKTVYVPVGHVCGEKPDLETVLDVLKSVLEDEEIGKIGQDVQTDRVSWLRLGVMPNGIGFDTMLASYLLDPGREDHSLDSLCKRFLGLAPVSEVELIGKGKKKMGFDEASVEDVAVFACEQVGRVLQLRDILMSELQNLEVDALFEEVDLPLIAVLAQMTFVGMAVEVPFLEQLASTLRFELDELTDEIYDLAGEPFNLNSPKQLSDILFEKLKLPPGRKTKTGYSTNQAVLEQLAMQHALPAKLLAYRELMKLQSTYVEALPQLVNDKTGRIHASFNQAVTATGRLSVSHPNLQNIPIRTALGQQVRKAFVGRGEGWLIMSADYSQIELRIMAHLADDAVLIEAFEKGEDVHSHTASMIFNLAAEFVTAEMRDIAKTVNYGVIYGMSPFGLAKQVGLTVPEARHFIDRYFETYAGVQDYVDDMIAWAREEGYVETMLGRRRYVPEIISVNARKRASAERIAVNTPIQGTASDLIKLAMIRIYDRLQGEGLASQMVLQVHDELVFEVPENEVNRVTDIVKEEMENALLLKVPVVVSVGVGKDWLMAH